MLRFPFPRFLTFVLFAAAGAARAETGTVRLRMAAIAPEGTAWAREAKALSRNVQAATNGEVELKWYLGGIAGSELEALERVRRGQLDGLAGASFCEKLAPSLQAVRITGVVQNRDEIKHLFSRLRPKLDAEFARSGFVDLGLTSFGSTYIFSRRPVRSVEDLRQQRFWIWNEDESFKKLSQAMGLQTVPLSVTEGASAYDEGRIDGFITIPSAALAFQWTVHARYLAPLIAGHLAGCLVIAQRAFDALPLHHQQALRSEAAKFIVRFDEVGRDLDDRLLGGLFEKQGMEKTPVSAQFHAEFFELARRAREQVAPALLPRLLQTIQGILADYRAANPPGVPN